MLAIRMYDIKTDEMRDATQEDWDLLWKFAQDVGRASYDRREKAKSAPTPENFSFKLAIFPNPMRDDGVFVCEDKEIEPYEGIRNLDGSPRYPATPNTKWSLTAQVNLAFAKEIVKRWNAYKGD